MTSKCPDCGLENVPSPEGSIQRCGRRAYGLDPSDDWKVRMGIKDACERAAERRGYSEAQWRDDYANDQKRG